MNNLAEGGFAPEYYAETYPSYGNKNQAGSMTNMDLIKAGFMTQGHSLTALGSGTQAGNTTTLIKRILDNPPYSGQTFACGGSKVYTLSGGANATTGVYPTTLNKAVVTGEATEDLAFYKGNLYVTYNHSGAAGDIAYSASGTGAFDEDWGSTTPTGFGTLQNTSTNNSPKPMVVAGDDKLYIGNERYVASYDNTTLILQALDLPTDYIIQSLKWMNDRLYIGAANVLKLGALSNYANNNIDSSIFVWDGTTDSWESEVKIKGLVGALHVKNGVLYVFYQDISSSGGYKLGYLSGTSIVDLQNFSGGLPNFGQVTDYKNFIAFMAGTKIMLWGAGEGQLPVRLFNLAASTYGTAGALARPFSQLYSASTDGASAFEVDSTASYTTTCTWKSLMFDVTSTGRESKLDFMRVNFEVLGSGARVDWVLRNNKGVALASDNISNGKLGGATTVVVPFNGIVTDTVRLELDFASGSTTNPVQIKSVKLVGHSE